MNDYKAAIFSVGDLVRIIDDPNSFVIGDDVVGLAGMIIGYDDNTVIYTVLLSSGTRQIRVLDFMMEKLKDETKKDRKSSRGRNAI